MSKKGFRYWVNILHLWFGIPSCVILFIMCLSGTLYAFHSEITDLFSTDEYALTGSPDTAETHVGEVIVKAENSHPGWKPLSVTAPSGKELGWTLTLQQEGTKKAKSKADQLVLIVDPYKGNIIAEDRSKLPAFFEKVLQLHRWLLLDRSIGGVITGTASLMMIFLLLSGIVLWFPAKWKQWKNRAIWRQGLIIKRGTHWKRFNFDLHKTLGFYAFCFVLVMAMTGPYFAFEGYKDVYTKFWGAAKTAKAPGKKQKPAHKPARVYGASGIDTLLTRLDKQLPYPGIVRITWPKDSSATYAIQKIRTGFMTLAATDRLVVDQVSLEQKKAERFNDKTMGEKIVSLTKAIHTGELLGSVTKLLYFIACLIATSLPVTGVLIWLNKRRKTARKATAVRN